MVENAVCPICGSQGEGLEEKQNCVLYHCQHCGQFSLSGPNVFGLLRDNAKARYVVNSFLTSHPWQQGGPVYDFYAGYSSEDRPLSVSIESLLAAYPETELERPNLALSNLYLRYPHKDCYVGNVCGVDLFLPFHGILDRTTYDGAGLDALAKLDYLAQLSYLEFASSDNKTIFSLTLKGIMAAEGFQMEASVLAQGFLAISFHDGVAVPIAGAIREGLKASHYLMMKMDEKEYAGQIVPEIFSEIRKSAFVVVDYTYPNCNVSYEAGFAKGLNKIVISECKRSEFVKTAACIFDVAQENVITWDTYDELTTKITKRINALVGEARSSKFF